MNVAELWAYQTVGDQISLHAGPTVRRCREGASRRAGGKAGKAGKTKGCGEARGSSGEARGRGSEAGGRGGREERRAHAGPRHSTRTGTSGSSTRRPHQRQPRVERLRPRRAKPPARLLPQPRLRFGKATSRAQSAGKRTCPSCGSFAISAVDDAMHWCTWYREGTGQHSPDSLRFRSPGGVRVGRDPLEPEVLRQLEAQHPDIAFDWKVVREQPAGRRKSTEPQASAPAASGRTRGSRSSTASTLGCPGCPSAARHSPPDSRGHPPTRRSRFFAALSGRARAIPQRTPDPARQEVLPRLAERLESRRRGRTPTR